MTSCRIQRVARCFKFLGVGHMKKVKESGLVRIVLHTDRPNTKLKSVQGKGAMLSLNKNMPSLAAHLRRKKERRGGSLPIYYWVVSGEKQS